MARVASRAAARELPAKAAPKTKKHREEDSEPRSSARKTKGVTPARFRAEDEEEEQQPATTGKAKSGKGKSKSVTPSSAKGSRSSSRTAGKSAPSPPSQSKKSKRVAKSASPAVKKASPTPKKASPTPKKASPTPKKASPTPKKASPTPKKASSAQAVSDDETVGSEDEDDDEDEDEEDEEDDAEEKKTQLLCKKIPQLKDLLKSRGLKCTGTKQELVDRLLSDPDAWTEPPSVNYEYDPDADAAKKTKVVLGIASSDRSNCVRCLRKINQASFRVGFEARDMTCNPFGVNSGRGGGMDIYRWMHSRCFARYPPVGIEDMADIRFDRVGDARRNGGILSTQFPVLQERLTEMWDPVEAAERVTAPQLEGAKQFRDKERMHQAATSHISIHGGEDLIARVNQ